MRLLPLAKDGSRGTRADQGVRPTLPGLQQYLEKTSGIKLKHTPPIGAGTSDVVYSGAGSVVVPAPAVLQGLSDRFVFSSDRARHSAWRL